jgi:cytochrome c biogenesis protein CcdA
LSVVNPCGFPLLPAFLTYYLGADEDRLPPAPTRILQGLVVGGLVAIGFLGLFAVVGLPVSLGVGAIADAVPWVGLATGVLLALAGLGVIAGRRDPDEISGKWFGNHRIGEIEGGIVWDAYYAFEPSTHWGARPDQVVATGAPIIGGVDTLQGRFVPLLTDR